MAKRKRSKKVPPPPPEGEGLSLPEVVEIRCPQCMEHWANARIDFGKPVLRSHFTPRKGLAGKIKFQTNNLPYCPSCNFRYDDKVMYALLMAAINKEKMGSKGWGIERYKDDEKAQARRQGEDYPGGPQGGHDQ